MADQYDTAAAAYGGTPVDGAHDAVAAKYGGVPMQYDPTEGMSMLDKLLAGAGKSVHDLGMGLGEKVGLVSPADVAAARKTDAPLMNTGAGFTGNVIGQLMQAMAVPVGGAATLAGKLALGAGVGAAQGAVQPTVDGESSLTNAAIGGGAGAAGMGVAAGLGRLVQPAAAATPEIAQAAKFGPLSYGQTTGGELTQRVESWLAKLPGAKAWYAQLGADQKAAVNSKISDLTMSGHGGPALSVAGEGKVFTSDPQFVQDLQNLPSQFNMLAGGLQPTQAMKTAAAYAGTAGDAPTTAMVGGRQIDLTKYPQLQTLVAQAQGAGPKLPVGATIPMTGPQGDFNNYQAIRSILGKQAFGAQAGTPDAAGYGAIRDAFDAASMRSLEAQGVDPHVLQNARNAYQVQKVLKPAEVLQPDGSVVYDPMAAGKAINKAMLDGTLKNLPDETQSALLDLANYAKTTGSLKTSGTPEGQMGRDVATGAILGDAIKDGPMAALKSGGAIAGAMYAAPWLINRGFQTLRGGLSVPPAVGMPLSQLAAFGPASFARSLTEQ